MPYYTQKQLEILGFKSIGKNVKISNKASIYDCEQIEIGNNSRIDDFCIISGKVVVGNNVHITSMCLIAGGKKGIVIEDFVTIAYGVKIFTQSDDYGGETMTNSTVPSVYKNEKKKEVVLKKHSIVGSSSIIFPGVTLNEGTSIGAMSLVINSTEPWGVYVGVPVSRIKDRSKKLLNMEREYKENDKY